MDDDLAQLQEYVSRTTALPKQQATRLIADILGFYHESVETYVVRRHRELMAAGLTNPAIFARIAEELPQRRFIHPPLSDRQLRRMIYG